MGILTSRAPVSSVSKSLEGHKLFRNWGKCAKIEHSTPQWLHPCLASFHPHTPVHAQVLAVETAHGLEGDRWMVVA